MSRKSDLLQHIRESDDLIRQYHEIIQVTQNPNEEKRSKREIARQRELISGYFEEYTRIVANLGEIPPDDMREIAAALGIPLPSAVAPQQKQIDPSSDPTARHIGAPPPGELPPPASQPGPGMRKFALVIGIGAYTKIRTLAKTVVDAGDLHALLLANGYERDKCTLLLDKAATKGAIGDALDTLARKVGPNDSVLLFFSGHGAQRMGGFAPGEYLCPIEADWYDLRSSAITSAEFTTALRALHPRQLFVFMDACHSGGVGEPQDIGGKIMPGFSAATYEGLAVGKGRVVIASCQPDEVSWELPGMRNGLFTTYLLAGLRGAAAGNDGKVKVFNLFEYVAQEVPKHKPQHPHFKGDLDDNIAVVEVPQSA